MARNLASLLQVGILVCLGSITIANGLSVEERLQQLSDQMVRIFLSDSAIKFGNEIFKYNLTKIEMRQVLK
jgi:hypothetical protein